MNPINRIGVIENKVTDPPRGESYSLINERAVPRAIIIAHIAIFIVFSLVLVILILILMPCGSKKIMKFDVYIT